MVNRECFTVRRCWSHDQQRHLTMGYRPWTLFYTYKIIIFVV